MMASASAQLQLSVHCLLTTRWWAVAEEQFLYSQLKFLHEHWKQNCVSGSDALPNVCPPNVWMHLHQQMMMNLRTCNWSWLYSVCLTPSQRHRYYRLHILQSTTVEDKTVCVPVKDWVFWTYKDCWQRKASMEALASTVRQCPLCTAASQLLLHILARPSTVLIILRLLLPQSRTLLHY